MGRPVDVPDGWEVFDDSVPEGWEVVPAPETREPASKTKTAVLSTIKGVTVAPAQIGGLFGGFLSRFGDPSRSYDPTGTQLDMAASEKPKTRTFKEGYVKTRDAIDKEITQAQSDNPTTAAVFETAASLATPGMGLAGKFVSKAPSLAGKVLRTGAVSTGHGALTGAAEAPSKPGEVASINELITAARNGGVVGGLTGTTIKVSAPIVKGVANLIERNPKKALLIPGATRLSVAVKEGKKTVDKLANWLKSKDNPQRDFFENKTKRQVAGGIRKLIEEARAKNTKERATQSLVRVMSGEVTEDEVKSW